MRFVLLDWKHRRKLFECLHPTILVNFRKKNPTRMRQTQIIDEKTGNKLFDLQTQRLKFKFRKHKIRHKDYSIQTVVLRKDEQLLQRDPLQYFVLRKQHNLLQGDPIKSEKPRTKFPGTRLKNTIWKNTIVFLKILFETQTKKYF